MNIKRWVPLWIKCPVSVFLHQIGRLPMSIVLRNAQWAYTQSRDCSADKRDAVYHEVQRTVSLYLSKKYAKHIDGVLSQASKGVREENAPIWVFWWQGFQDAPHIVKVCIDNVIKNAGSHPVNIIDSGNYHRYIQIPAYIEKKLRERKMSLTHFSDFLRMKLLAEHGGLWVDATIFVQKEMDFSVFEAPIWTVRNPGCDTTNISCWEWAINFIGGWKGNALFCAAAAVLDQYWMEHDMVADYFMTDCLVRVIYDRCELVREIIDEIPASNPHFYFLQDNFNLPLDEHVYESELVSDTWLYKISWKGEYRAELPDGRETFYGKWLTDFGSAVLGGNEK